MRRVRKPRKKIAALAVAVVGAMLAATPVAMAMPTRTLGSLDGPRGVAMTPGGRLFVAQANGTFGRVIRSGPHRGHFVKLGRVPMDPTFPFAPALGYGKGKLFILTSGSSEATRGQGILFTYDLKTGKRRALANIQKYQNHDQDPYDLEGLPKDSNPYGVAGLPDGSALVADAAGNDLLRVFPSGNVITVATLKPRTVKAANLGPEGPPPGTKVPTEAVATSVAVGADGAYYVGELRGAPGRTGTSQVWRIRPESHGVVCDPAHPRKGACKRYADGLTSIVALGAGPGGAIYVVELSKKGWLSTEADPPVPGAQIGALIKIRPNGTRRELARNKLVLPGGVAVGKHGVAFVSGPVFGPGTLTRVR